GGEGCIRNRGRGGGMGIRSWLKNDSARCRPGKCTEPGDSMLTWSTDDDSHSFVRPGCPLLCRKASPCFRREAFEFSRTSRSCCEYCGCASQTRFCSRRPVGTSPPQCT